MLKQSLSLKLGLKLSPQQMLVTKLLQLPTQAFEQRLKEEMNENPALETGSDEEQNEKEEFDDIQEFDNSDENDNNDSDEINIDEYLSDDDVPEYKTQTNNYSNDDEEYESPLAESVSFHQDLINQLNTFIINETEFQIAEFLVGSIDDMGYLRRSISDIVDDLAFTQSIYTDEKKVSKVLHLIHQLEPAGVGAANLQDCLLLQLRRKTPTDNILLAITLIEEHFDAFSRRHYEKLVKILNISNQELKNAINEIERLNPKPGSSYTGSAKVAEHVVPDFTIRIVDDELELILNGRNAPSLHISKDYQQLLQTYKSSYEKNRTQKDAVQFIKQKLDAAQWFIEAIKQRQETLLVTMNAIMHFQQDYFLEGDETKIKPMILKDIADEVGLDVSTISRVANSKYVETPYGTKLIKEFFSEAMKNDQGEDVSTIEIKRILKTLVENEDKLKPLTDDQLADALKEKGFPIARRTIAKYRETLEIPVARMRRKI